MVKEHPSFRLVYGDLKSVDLIEEESKKADIVCSKSPVLPLSAVLVPNVLKTSLRPIMSRPPMPSSEAWPPMIRPAQAFSFTRLAQAFYS